MFRKDCVQVDLTQGKLFRSFTPIVIGEADVRGDQFGVEVYQDGEAYALDGMSCVGYFIRSDGDTVVISGSNQSGISGNLAWVRLPQTCYAYEGKFSLAIKVTEGNNQVTMRIVDGVVARTTTDSVVDPGSTVPDLTTLLAQISAMETATAAAQAASTQIAPTYSSSSAYDVGDYVFYNGAMYQCTTAIASPGESWTASHWTATTVAGELTSQSEEIATYPKTLQYSATGNLYLANDIITGKYIDPSTGAITTAPNEYFAYSPTFIPVTPGETIVSNNRMYIAYYDRNYNILSALQMDSTKQTTVPSSVVYARFSVSSLDHASVIVQHGSAINSEKQDYTFILDGLDVSADALGVKQATSLMNFTQGANLYNSYNLVTSKYINPSTGFIDSTTYTSFAYSPTYIPVTAGDVLTATDKMMIAYYDDHYNVLSALQMDSTKQTTVPSGAVYARFSCSSADHSNVKVVVGSSISEYTGRYSFTLDGLELSSESAIIVDASGSGDYTSLTEAVYANVDNGRKITVLPGEYDIETEYIALFGQDVVDSLADATSGINNFQYGIRIHDRTIEFMPGASVVCDWTGKTVDGTHRFCAFRVEQGAEIIGLRLTCTATFYAIHDDYGPETPFTIAYRNCHIDAYNLTNANCIGGGCHKYSRHIIDNCYFNNHVTSSDLVLSADVRYHNTNTADAEPEVHVSNCYFSNNMNLAYYGSQTTKMRAYVNNCYAPSGINKVRESSTMNTDNVDLYVWNNQTS